MKTIRRAASAAALLSSVSMLAVAAPALAQETTADAGRATEIITVTARRREESLQDVPVAVSALGAQRLEETGALDITDLGEQTPNATVQIARGSNTTLISFIRGVGQQDPLWGFEPGVGLYVDDVYVARPQGAVLDIYDVERIEVLRGPQGTLYGRNTIGGAIKYVTRRLDDQPQGSLRAAYGSHNQIDLVASGSAPLAEGFAIGGSIARFTRDGYGTNLTTGQDHYNKDIIAGRISAEMTPHPDVFIRFAYDRLEDDSNPRHGYRTLPGALPGSDVLDDIYDTRAGAQGDNSVMTQGASLTAEWQASDMFTFKSITAWREGDTVTVIDFDGTPSPTLDIPAFYRDDQFTQEFQLLFDAGRFQGVAGVYYLDGTAEGAFDTIAGLLGVNIANGGSVETESFAAFADVSFDITDRLSASVGARWTRDEKTGTVFRATYLGTERSPLNGGPDRDPLIQNTDYTNTRTFSEFTPRVSLSYRIDPNYTAYASYSQGFKSGGFDMRGDALATPDTVNGYNPETVDAWEAGLKGRAFDGLMQFSAAAFYSDYQDQQVTTQVPTATGIASFVDNVGQSTIYGAEFEGALFLTDFLTANFSVGYLEASFDEFIRFNLTTGEFEDISDQVVFQNAPKWTGYFGLTWRTDVMGGDLAVTPSVSFRSSYNQFEFPNPLLDQNGYTLVDLSALWTSPDQRWTVGAFGRNLTDEEYRIGGYNFLGAQFDDSVSAFYGPPRTFTVQLGYRF
ncbi:TonB-dependent receptor [Glycocaulis profundi]|nr:TonB-dependent receptor [Glycocaulis profundi]